MYNVRRSGSGRTAGLASALVEAFGGVVASYSQDPLTCRHVNQLELADELDDSAVAGCRLVVAGED
jgi:hypothetical protein